MLEGLSMKWVDRPRVTEMDRGGYYEMERRTKCHKIEMPLKWKTFSKIFGTATIVCYKI